MLASRLKKIIPFFLLLIIFCIIKCCSYFKSTSSIPSLKITSPSLNSSCNGIIRIAAKTADKSNTVNFILKKENNNETIAAFKPYFESDVGEWAYYWNTAGVENGNYIFEAKILDRDSNPRNITNRSFIIQNDIESALANAAGKNTTSIPAFEESPKIADEQLETSHPEINTAQKQTKIIEPNNGIESLNGEQEKILAGVLKALDKIYSVISDRIGIAEEIEIKGQVAGATSQEDNSPACGAEVSESQIPEAAIKDAISSSSSETVMKKISGGQEIASTTIDIADENSADEHNWFRYDLKIISHENKEKISGIATLSAGCNNPLDSVAFIFDNLETKDIDYSFKAENNYGYYTHWAYKLNTADIKKGDYLLYAKGLVDWYTYESPMIIVKID